MNTELKRDLLDTDGENRAVRWFLACYSNKNSPTAKQMRDHLAECGYPHWPEWAAKNDEHLTKGGAQDWLRHLFALEKLPSAIPTSGQVQPVSAGLTDAALEDAVQAVAARAGESETISVISAFDAIRGLKKNRFALPSAAQRDSQPDHFADAGEMVPDIPPFCEMARGWGVTVTIYGQPILHIGDDCLSGLADLDPWSSTIRGCAKHLIAFIGAEADSQPVADTSADARDAARYRWLTKHAYIDECGTDNGLVWQVSNVEREVPIKAGVNEAIDAAIAASREKP